MTARKCPIKWGAAVGQNFIFWDVVFLIGHLDREKKENKVWPYVAYKREREISAQKRTFSCSPLEKIVLLILGLVSQVSST